MGIRALIDKIYYMRPNRITSKGFIYIDGNSIADVGAEAPVEYSLSELYYSFDGKAFAIHGFSIALTPSLYPFRGTGSSYVELSVFSKEEIRGFIKSAFYELLVNGITLPIVYREKDEYIGLVIDVAKSISIPLVIMGGKELLDRYNNSIDNKMVYSMVLGVDVAEKNICYDEISGSCDVVYLKNTLNINSLIAFSVMNNGVYETIEVLVKPYKILGISKGFVDKGSRADILVYDGRSPPKAPLLSRAPYSVITRGYPPDIVFLNGDIVVERGVVYPISDMEVSKALEVVYSKMVG